MRLWILIPTGEFGVFLAYREKTTTVVRIVGGTLLSGPNHVLVDDLATIQVVLA